MLILKCGIILCTTDWDKPLSISVWVFMHLTAVYLTILQCSYKQICVTKNTYSVWLPLYNMPTCYSLLPLQHLVAHLCTSQGRSKCVFHPSPSALHSTGPTIVPFRKISQLWLLHKQHHSLHWRSTRCPCEASLCALLAGLKIMSRRRSSAYAWRYVLLHNNEIFLSMCPKYEKDCTKNNEAM